MLCQHQFDFNFTTCCMSITCKVCVSRVGFPLTDPHAHVRINSVMKTPLILSEEPEVLVRRDAPYDACKQMRYSGCSEPADVPYPTSQGTMSHGAPDEQPDRG